MRTHLPPTSDDSNAHRVTPMGTLQEDSVANQWIKQTVCYCSVTFYLKTLGHCMIRKKFP